MIGKVLRILTEGIVQFLFWFGLGCLRGRDLDLLAGPGISAGSGFADFHTEQPLESHPAPLFGSSCRGGAADCHCRCRLGDFVLLATARLSFALAIILPALEFWIAYTPAFLG